MAPSFRRSYAMHGVIAAGGMATVHVGRLLGPSGFTRRVAIKRLHPQLAANAEMASMFAEEARLSARVIHANVVPVLDVVSADGELLLVMEYVHGESLSRLLMQARKDGTVTPIPLVAAVLADVLHGLEAAHEARGEDGLPLRLVHRDVSPQNVLVGVDGIARVVDFGIAKAVGLAPVTRDGQLRGKIPYMAPEQLARRSIDRRVDVYAAGVVLWEALAGRRLFEADDEPTLFSKILEDVIPPPGRFNPAVSPELDAIALRALERDPERRYPDARSMAVALEAAVVRASPLAVADWVKTSAAPALATRDARIAEMERAAIPEASTESAQVGLPAIRAPFASVFLTDGATGATVVSKAPAAPVPPSVEPQAPAPPSRSRRRLLAGVALGLLAAVVSVSLVFARRGESPVAPAGSASTAGSIDVTPSASEPGAVGAAAPSSPSPVDSSSAQALSSAAASRPPGRGGSGTRLCKVFDPDKRIYVMRPMRVSRCP